MNKIFINNLPEPSQIYWMPAPIDNNPIQYTISRSVLDNKPIIQNIISTLLTHERISIKARQINSIITAFGVQDTLELLKNNYFELIDDYGVDFVIQNHQNYGEPTTIFASTTGANMSSLEYLEEYFNKVNHKESDLYKLILLNAERNSVKIDINLLEKNIFNELDYDLKNSNLTQSMGIISSDRKHLDVRDSSKFLRLLRINSGLVYSIQNNCDNIFIDGEIKSILPCKLSPIIQSKQIDSIAALTDILKKKNIPDLSDLYISKTITIHDVIKIRENLNGKKFRQWLSDVNYNQDTIIETLVNSSSSINSRVSKTIRFLVTNAVSFIGPVSGITVSAIDSFVIDKILKGWHPNIFLDDVLKKEIDDKIAADQLQKRREQVGERFKGVGRNDPCPCGSGKKFKKCCGR